MMKRLPFLLIAAIVFFLLSGCIETEVEFTFHKNKTYDSKIQFTTSELMGGVDFDMYVWQIGYLFPEVQAAYKYEKVKQKAKYDMESTEEPPAEALGDLSNFDMSALSDFGAKAIHTYTAKGKKIAELKGNPGLSFTKEANGVYAFESTIPKLLEQVSDDEKNEVVLVIHVEMPGPIDVANTIEVSGNRASWRLHKQLFTKGVTLKARTKR